MARSNGISYTMTTNYFSGLRDFFSAYFHEDWVLEAKDPDHVVSSYLAVGWSAKELNELASQMLRFAESISDDAALEQALFTDRRSHPMSSVGGAQTARIFNESTMLYSTDPKGEEAAQ